MNMYSYTALLLLAASGFCGVFYFWGRIDGYQEGYEDAARHRGRSRETYRRALAAADRKLRELTK